jgi:hypothetical protein
MHSWLEFFRRLAACKHRNFHRLDNGDIACSDCGALVTMEVK